MTRLTIGGIPARDLASEFGTPCYVHDADVVRTRYEELRRALPHDAGIYVSIKAHANVALLDLVHGLGARVDACSPGDLAFAGAAGIPGSDVSYQSHGGSRKEIEGALDSGALVVVDSEQQLRWIADHRPGARVGIRVNNGIEAGFAPLVRADARSSKFGIHARRLPAALALAADRGLHVIGLHGHLGSDLFDPGPHLALLDALLLRARDIPSVEFVDIGGGWGIPFLPPDAGDRYPPVDAEPRYPFDRLRAGVATRMRKFTTLTGRALQVRVEPGAYLMMDAGWLLASVTDIKEPVDLDSCESDRFVCTDTSYDHVHSAVAHGTFHEVFLTEGAELRPRAHQTVTGNLMQAGDVLAHQRVLPLLEIGDVIAIARCGAYKACRASNFNERSRPAEVLVDGGTARLVRRRETVEDLLELQVVDGRADSRAAHSLTSPEGEQT